MPITENQIAEYVRTWLKADGYEVYPEVPAPLAYSAPIIDLVAIRLNPGESIVFVETKTSMSKSLLRQIQHHFEFGADQVYAAIPKPTRRDLSRERIRELNEWKAKTYGAGQIGLIHVDRISGECAIRIESKRLLPIPIMEAKYREYFFNLPEKMKMYKAPGTRAGGVLTAFRHTCDLVHDFVYANPGCTVRELVNGIEHHYSSPETARGAITARCRLIQEKAHIEYRYESGKYHLYPGEYND